MTIQQLLDMIDLEYANAFTDAEKVKFMNQCQRELSRDFGTIVEDESLVTVADQDYYSLPTGLDDISQIIALGVGNKETPTTRYDYIKYEPGSRDDYPLNGYTYWQSIDSSGDKTLILYPVPANDDYPIKIRYRKNLTALSESVFTGSPDFDSNYHDILAYYALKKICSNGASPDAEQANNFQQQYDDLFNKMWYDKLKRERKRKENRTDNPHWRTGRRYAGD